MSGLAGEQTSALIERKNVQRRAALAARNAQPKKEVVSRAAIERFVQLPEYQQAQTVMCYIDCRSELRTKPALATALGSGKRIVIPYCTVDDHRDNKLGLWWLKSMDELVVGKWGILEPPRERWQDPERVVAPRELDIVVVPGVGFSRQGGRMGNGQGYYDRLLEQVRPDCSLIALCFECQLFDDLIVGPHDVFMDLVVTERAIYRGLGRH